MSLIKNRNRVKQVIDFTGVQNGKMHPSDIDAVLEFDNDILILMEVKYQYTKIPTGQKLLLERLADSWHTERAIVLKVEHDFDKENFNIPLEKCKVTAIYFNHEWTYYQKGKDFIEYINKIGKKWNCSKCKF